MANMNPAVMQMQISVRKRFKGREEWYTASMEITATHTYIIVTASS